MGANNKNSDIQKCGELMIDIKKIKHKKKSYIYRCAFCGNDCEILKTFTKHLEDKHFRNFEQELLKEDPVQMESESSNHSLTDPEDFKMQQQIFIVETNDNPIASNNSLVHGDPLNMLKIETNIDNGLIENNMDVLKIEKEEQATPDLEANANVMCEDNDYVMSCNDSCSEFEDDNKTKDTKIPTKLIITQKRYTSDVSSDDSRDSDFDIEKELNSNKKPKKIKKENKKDTKRNKESKEKLIDDQEYPTSRRIYKNSLSLFIEQYKKYEDLWKVDNIAFGVKTVRLEIYTKIADELKLHLRRNINVHGVHVNIKYLNRLYSKDKEQELLCKIENKDFIPESDLYTELSSFLSESQGPFLCSICNKIIPKFDTYCQHVAEHNGTPAFKCTSCEMTFAKFDKYGIHKRRHLNIYNFYCNVCERGFPFQAELDYHLTSHTGLKQFLCSICGEGFKARNNYATHMLRHENRFRYECHICKKGFMQLHSLKSHVNWHLNIRDIKCKICNMGFTGKKYLKRHEQKCHSNKS